MREGRGHDRSGPPPGHVARVHHDRCPRSTARASNARGRGAGTEVRVAHRGCVHQYQRHRPVLRERRRWRRPRLAGDATVGGNIGGVGGGRDVAPAPAGCGCRGCRPRRSGRGVRGRVGAGSPHRGEGGCRLLAGEDGGVRGCPQSRTDPAGRGVLGSLVPPAIGRRVHRGRPGDRGWGDPAGVPGRGRGGGPSGREGAGGRDRHLGGERSRQQPGPRRRPLVRLREHQRGILDMSVGLPPRIRERTVSKARTLLEALPFMREHWGKTIVVKYGGAAMERATLSRTFGNDLALLQHVGIHPLIVHGGGPQLTEVSARLGLPTTFVGGLRVTDEPTLDVAKMVLAGKVNTEVVGSLVACGVQAVGLSGVYGGLVMGGRRDTPDMGFVGEVVRVNGSVLRALMEQRFVPVIASIAIGDDGQAYNVNADVVAAELAVALSAEKLVYMNDVPGLIGPDGDLLSELGVTEVLDVLAHTDAVEGGMIPKLESAVRALKAGVPRVPFLDGRVEHALVLELFTPEGIGTMIAVDAPGEEGTP